MSAWELQEAGRIWDRMESRGLKPNAFSYAVLIKGFCWAGKAREAVVFLRELVESRFVPDEATSSVLFDSLDSTDRDDVQGILGRVRNIAQDGRNL